MNINHYYWWANYLISNIKQHTRGRESWFVFIKLDWKLNKLWNDFKLKLSSFIRHWYHYHLYFHWICSELLDLILSPSGSCVFYHFTNTGDSREWPQENTKHSLIAGCLGWLVQCHGHMRRWSENFILPIF